MGLRRLAILGWVWSGCGDVARPRVSIAPAEPGTDDDLVAVPPPGLDELYDWTWSRDGRVVPELRGDRVPAALTAKGEAWEVAVVRHDGGRSSPAGRAEVTIGNAAPSVTVRLIPDPPVAGIELVAAVDAVDPDDEPVALAFAWTVDGAPAGFDAATIPGDAIAGGQAWEVTVTASDGLGSAVAVASAVAGNTAPRVTSARIEPGAPTENDTLTVAWTAVDFDDDPVTVTVGWFVNDLWVRDGATLPPEFFHRDDVIRAEVTPHDGLLDGAAVASFDVVAVNTPPSAIAAAVSPGVLTEGLVASCLLSGVEDLDGDAVTPLVRWFVGGTFVATGPSLTGASFAAGQAVACEGTPFDGLADGPPSMSPTVIVSNSPPVVGTVFLDPDPPTAAGPVTAYADGLFDPDGDAVVTHIDWTIDGVPMGTADSWSGLVRGQTVEAELIAWDGAQAALRVSSGPIVVGNALPVMVRTALIPAQPRASDAIDADVVGVDADGDPLTFEVRWTLDGVEVFLGPTLPAGTGSPGALVGYTVTPHDGADPGPTAASPVVALGN